MAGLIYVSKLAANSRVATHRGPTNLRLRCHLGVQIPKGDCGIRVDAEYQTWREGKCLVFDDFYHHEVWNETNEERVVLIVDLWNPQLSARERRRLAGIQHYTIRQAKNLQNHWANNENLRHEKREGYD